nr:MAG TPA: hypothetical protein [Caudoviricetes sp.]
MKMYEVFKSEGGYRVCCAMWAGDSPVIERCPWYETEAQAIAAAQFLRFEASAADVKLFWNDYVTPACWTVMWDAKDFRLLTDDYPSYPEALRAAREIVKSRGFSDVEIDKFRPSWDLKRLEGDAV